MIELKQEMLESYIDELHHHLFEGQSLNALLMQITTNHRANHLVTLYAMKDQSTFDQLYSKRADVPGLEALLDAVIAALLEDQGFELQLVLRERLAISPRMLAGTPSEHDKVTVIKHLRSYVLYARKKDPTGFVPPLPASMMSRIKPRGNQGNRDV